MTLMISSHPCSMIPQFKEGNLNLHTVEAEAQAVPQQAKMQAAVAAGPVSTGGVLLRLINTMIDTKMTKEFNETIFIISSCQLTRNLWKKNYIYIFLHQTSWQLGWLCYSDYNTGCFSGSMGQRMGVLRILAGENMEGRLFWACIFKESFEVSEPLMAFDTTNSMNLSWWNAWAVVHEVNEIVRPLEL